MSDIKLTPEELEEMLDNAARRGAKEALRSIGLLDDDAAKDIIEMRNLIEAWRDTRRSIRSTVVKMTTVGVLTFIAGAVWMTMGK
jgi:2-iminoacetate synthase ThiH|tara:strand:+ start:289 stop:543 length:255 start_codon:yes stop_codon:yes gene_type:complete